MSSHTPCNTTESKNLVGCEGSFLGLGAAKGSICKLYVGWLIEGKD